MRKTTIELHIISAILCVGLVFMTLDVSTAYSAEAKWIKVSNIHSFFQSYGSEPEEAFILEQQAGMRWPAFYAIQDCQAARGMWIGLTNYTDVVANNKVYSHKVVHCGPRPRTEIEENEFMPVTFKLVGRMAHSDVYVDGEPATPLVYDDIVEEYDPSMGADRMLYTKVNTEVGITFTKKIYAFSQQYNDNYFIYDFTFKNTGICSKADATGAIQTHQQTLQDVYFHWQYRNAVSKEGNVEGAVIDYVGDPGWGTPRSMRWGIHCMNHVIGIDPVNPSMAGKLFTGVTDMGGDKLDDDGNTIRAFYSWGGRHSGVSYDNIGSPNYQGYKADGRMGASQFIGVATIHADKSVSDKSDDPYQPAMTRKIESNDKATLTNTQWDEDRMTEEYQGWMSSGHPTKTQAEEVGAGFADQTAGVGGGGFSQAIAFGPYTMAPGDSIHIVMAEGIAGISREKNLSIGRNWYSVVKDKKTVNVTLADGTMKSISSETDANNYKDAWVYTAEDSLIQTYRRAISLYKNGLSLGDETPPDPPSTFEVESQGNRIYLKWTTNAETHPRFEGYKIYRALGAEDSTYYLIGDLNKSDGNLAAEFSDFTAVRGQSYYYYVVSYDNGSTNTISPGYPLHSSPFYTRTNKAAFLRKPPADDMSEIRIVPNPYNIRNRNLQYSGEYNKIMFLNLPVECKIRIFTERGDLIYTINHYGSGDNRWDLITSSRQIVVSGVYIATFETPDGKVAYQKFVIIR
ncbi:MAG: hypothetical protein PHW79_02080 [Candidatus Marinimicrobia bacterium]|nr:hypothetical protein [Candidatus Neomarinimicrobiota bacterium]